MDDRRQGPRAWPCSPPGPGSLCAAAGDTVESARGAWGPWPAGDGAQLGLGVGGRRPTEGRQCEHAEISAKSGSAPTSFQGTSGRRSWRRREVSGRRQGLREVGQAPVGVWVWGLQRAAEVWEATTERMSRGLRPAPRKRGARGRGQRRPPGVCLQRMSAEGARGPDSRNRLRKWPGVRQLWGLEVLAASSP